MDDKKSRLLIVGTGHAGSELALAARQGGWTGPITLLGDEKELPYQRPPLSKAYLLGKTDASSLALRPAEAYQNADIDLMLGVRVTRIERDAHTIYLADGRSLCYGKLALCTGGRPRPLVSEGLTEKTPDNLFYLRTLKDADKIRAKLHPASRVVVVGGGYVGLEVAASACGLGAKVTVLETQTRVLSRVVGEPVSRFYEAVHRQAGVNVLTNTSIVRIECERDQIVAVHTSHGERLEADLLIAGVGMLANIELAQNAGLAQEMAIIVDENCCTSDPDVVAAGDCTIQIHELYGRQLRLESVPNALEQARTAAAWLCGTAKPNRAVPWFWSDQYDMKLQMAGMSQGYDSCVLRGDPNSRSFCAFYLHGRRLLAVDAVNRPSEFMQVRRAIARGVEIDKEAIKDEALNLKDLLESTVILEKMMCTGKP